MSLSLQDEAQVRIAIILAEQFLIGAEDRRDYSTDDHRSLMLEYTREAMSAINHFMPSSVYKDKMDDEDLSAVLGEEFPDHFLSLEAYEEDKMTDLAEDAVEDMLTSLIESFNEFNVEDSDENRKFVMLCIKNNLRDRVRI
jgi:uncharacterized protein YqeY